MKRLLAVWLSTFFAVPIFATAAIHAEGTNSDTTTTTTQPKTESTENEAAETAEQKTERLKRIERHKTELKVRLNAAEKLKLQNKCKASQGSVSSVKGRIKGIETSRAQVHSNLVDRLTKLSERLKEKGVDTATLDADIDVLKTKIDTFNTDLLAYKQSVSDLVNVDCKTDPDGFKAALLAARTAQAKVAQDGQAIKAYVNDTIKPLLKVIRAEIEKKDNTSTTTEDQ